jgi:hypothetical protein
VRTRRPAALAALVSAALAVTACGGGGGGGPTQPPPPPPPTPGIVFTPATGGGQSGFGLAAGGGGTTTLVLELRASGLQDVYGVAFDLDYPETVLRFERATQGAALSAGGAFATSFQAVESPAGNLVVGLSRLGAVGGMSGSGTLLTLEFSARAAGSGTFTFVGPSAVAPNGQPLPGLTWTAGTATVTQ